jgi:IclR family acetate operon transcriptional repressor
MALEAFPNVEVYATVPTDGTRFAPGEISTREAFDVTATRLHTSRPAAARAARGSAAVGTRTVERALALLGVVTEAPTSLSECARLTSLPPSTALRLLRTLEAAGFARRDASGDYGAGPRMVQLGATSLGSHELTRVSRPALERIVEATGESTYLSVRGVGDTALSLALVEGTHAVRHTSWVGRSIPMAGLAIGRALTGDVPEKSGYVAERDHVEPDVTAIVAPIRARGGVIGALSVLGPTYRIDDETMHRYGRVVAEEGIRLSEQFGAGVREDHS